MSVGLFSNYYFSHANIEHDTRVVKSISIVTVSFFFIHVIELHSNYLNILIWLIYYLYEWWKWLWVLWFDQQWKEILDYLKIFNVENIIDEELSFKPKSNQHKTLALLESWCLNITLNLASHSLPYDENIFIDVV